MIIRPAQLEDAPRIADIHVTGWHTAYPGMVPDSLLATVNLADKTRVWTQILSEGSRAVLVAEQPEGTLVGWASLGPSRDPDADARVGEIYAMYVDPQSWRRGVGRALWSACRHELSKSYFCATLWVLKANDRARRFYEVCGFVLEPDVVHQPERAGLDQVRYRQRFVAIPPFAQR